jgi:hypothetical protein
MGNNGNRLEALWYIEVQNLRGVTTNIDGAMFSKVISIGGSGGGRGWPGALKGVDQGPGTCPNGLVATDGFAKSTRQDVPIYCYAAIEDALADTSCPHCPHLRPPFIELSTAGWRDAPDGSGPPRPPEPLPPPEIR